MLRYIILGLIGAFVALAIYVRLAPTNAVLWHNPDVPVLQPGTYPAQGSYIEQRQLQGNGRDVLARLDAIIQATPRTKVVAGSVDDGKVTYVTRSQIIGFPDFTTVTLAQSARDDLSSLQIYGRLRYGRSDFGVNKARIEGWVAQLDGDAQ